MPHIFLSIRKNSFGWRGRYQFQLYLWLRMAHGCLILQFEKGDDEDDEGHAQIA
jgi:hypothetical protein